jgi:hypothetical protein
LFSESERSLYENGLSVFLFLGKALGNSEGTSVLAFHEARVFLG